MHSTRMMAAPRFAAGGLASTAHAIEPAASQGSRGSRLRSMASRLRGRSRWEAGGPVDEAVAPSRRELPMPFC